MDLNGRSLLIPRVLYRFVRRGDDETVAVNHATYHVQQSELTAGRSHFSFLVSLPWKAQPPDEEVFDPIEGKLRQLLFLATCCGLTLCVQDCIAAIQKVCPDLKRPEVSRRVSRSSDLMYLLMDPPLGQIHEHYFYTVRVLLETFGYHPVTDSLGNQDMLFVKLLLQILRLELNGANLPDSPLFKVVSLVLEYGTNQDLPLTLKIPNHPFPKKKDVRFAHCPGTSHSNSHFQKLQPQCVRLDMPDTTGFGPSRRESRNSRRNNLSSSFENRGHQKTVRNKPVPH